jgi:hypothetical protein
MEAQTLIQSVRGYTQELVYRFYGLFKQFHLSGFIWRPNDKFLQEITEDRGPDWN